VISALATLANLNIVVAPEAADRRVTIRLIDVSLEEALNLLTQPLGLGWVRTGRNIVIMPESKLPGEAFEIRYYQLAHANAEDIGKAIEPLLFGRRLTAPAASAAPSAPASPAPGATPAPAAPVAESSVGTGSIERSQISVDKRTNTLIIIASRGDHDRAADIVRRLDVPIPVARLSTRVYPMQWLNADLKAPEGGPAKDVGAEMVALVKAHLGPQAIVTYDYTNNALIVTAVDGDHDRARGLLSLVDVQLPQLVVEITVVDVNRDLIDALGVEWSFTTGDAPSVTFQLPAAPAGSISFGTVTRQATSFSATLRAVVTDGRGRLLANPRVVTKDGQPAQVFIGDQVPVVTGTTSTGIPVVTFIDAGIKLNITPKINPGGIVTTRILTEVGAVRNFATGVGRATRTAFTTLSVRDGTPIVIGGLIRNEERVETQKVPLLGDIPIIGFLFRREATTRNNSEIVLVLTPRILRAQE
jgi:type II secretory pathway component GspD/PulD (secretin)